MCIYESDSNMLPGPSPVIMNFPEILFFPIQQKGLLLSLVSDLPHFPLGRCKIFLLSWCGLTFFFLINLS